MMTKPDCYYQVASCGSTEMSSRLLPAVALVLCDRAQAWLPEKKDCLIVDLEKPQSVWEHRRCEVSDGDNT
jgi:hypothetical protein